MADSIRVLHITDSLTAGILQVVKVLTGQHSQVSSHSIAYIAKPGTLPHSELRQVIDGGVELIRIAQSRSVFARFWHAFRYAFKTLRNENVHIVHAHSSVAGSAVRAAAILLGESQKVCYSPHAFAFTSNAFNTFMTKVFLLVERLLAKSSAEIWATSESEYRMARDILKSSKVVLVRNGIEWNLKLGVSGQTVNPEPKSSLKICFAGRDSRQKDPGTFVELALRFPAHEFVWIGDLGVERFERGSLENLRATGWITESEVIEEIKSSDIYLTAALWEGMSISLLYAVSAGLPIVARDIESHREIVSHGLNGYLFDSLDEAEQQLRLFIDNPEIRHAAREQSLTVAKAFSAKAMVELSDSRYLKISLKSKAEVKSDNE
jgi:glycosyltransferase involved in cell wall biosynthesis